MKECRFFKEFSDAKWDEVRNHPYFAKVRERSLAKDKIWKTVQGGWIRNAELVKRTVSVMAKNENAVVEGLVEDAMLDEKIAFPVALFAELLWDPDADTDRLIEEISKFPSVKFSNL